jgi:Cdc6-like AAA superfamily ATPase
MDDRCVHQLQQLFEWAHAPGSTLILIITIKSDFVQTLPRPQHQVVFKPFDDGTLVAILSAYVGTDVQSVMLELCAKQASGSVRRARQVCCLAIEFALGSNSSVVTLSHMEMLQALLQLTLTDHMALLLLHYSSNSAHVAAVCM